MAEHWLNRSSYESREDYLGALYAYDQLVELQTIVVEIGGGRIPTSPPDHPDLASVREEVVLLAADQLYEQGEEAARRDDSAGAARLYRECLTYDPSNDAAAARFAHEAELATRRVAILNFECSVRGTVRLNDESSDHAWIGAADLVDYALVFNNDLGLQRYWNRAGVTDST